MMHRIRSIYRQYESVHTHLYPFENIYKGPQSRSYIHEINRSLTLTPVLLGISCAE